MTKTGYTKSAQIEISDGLAGQQQINELIEAMVDCNHKKPRAWSFSVFEGRGVSKTTWQHGTALILEFRVGEDLAQDTLALIAAAEKLHLASWVLDTCDRYWARTLSLIVPCDRAISSDYYARLVYVLMEELRGSGLRLPEAGSSSAMTHLLHVHPHSACRYIEGRTLNPVAKIAATRRAAQSMDRERFTIAEQAAGAQLDEPTRTYQPAFDPNMSSSL